MANPDLSKLRIDRNNEVPANSTKISRAGLIGVIIGLVFIAYLLLGGEGKSGESTVSDSDKARVSAAEQAANGSTQAASFGSAYLSASGYVVAQRQAAVASKATGRLKEIYVEEGDLVQRGDLLGILESEDLSAIVRQSEANLAVLQARVKYAEAEFLEASRENQRYIVLSQKELVSQSETDQIISRFSKATADIELAQANLQAGAAELERRRVELEYTRIIAPFDGTVLTKNADIGEIVAPFGSSSNAKAAIVTIADMSSLEVEADVSEANITKVFVGQECSITLDSYPDAIYQGLVSKIVPTVDRAKGTVLTKIKFLNRDNKVLPEMSAKINFKPKGAA